MPPTPPENSGRVAGYPGLGSKAGSKLNLNLSLSTEKVLIKQKIITEIWDISFFL